MKILVFFQAQVNSMMQDHSRVANIEATTTTANPPALPLAFFAWPDQEIDLSHIRSKLMQHKDSELLVWLEMLRVAEASQADQAW